ncbi:MAG: rod shape-determining protein MreD [Nitrospirae bacterium]|nr:rod shape-determining protein MreD [Nitrospirota bacterium]
MKNFKLYVFWITILIGSIILDEYSFYGFRPNLAALVFYYFGIRWKPGKSLLWAFVTGAVLDSMSMRLIGPNILSKGTIIFLAHFFKTGIFNLTSLLNGLLSFAFTFVDGLLVYSSLAVFDVKPAGYLSGLYVVLLQSLANGVIAYFLIDEDD